MEKRNTYRILKKYIKTIGYFSLLILFSFYSCNGNEKESDFSKLDGFEEIHEFNVIYDFLKIDDSWNIKYQYKDEDEIILNVSKSDSTIIFNNAVLRKNIIEGAGMYSEYHSKCFVIDQIYYNWEYDDKEYYVFYNDRLDTIYHYYYLGEPTEINQQIFLQGKYNFLYNNFLLNDGQKRFFETHRDSLSRVKGHNLPQLPELLVNE